MRKTPLITAAAMLLLSCSNLTLGFDPLGPPKAMLDQGQPGWRLEYIYSKMSIEANGAFGVPPGGIQDVEMNRIYANIGYGLNDRWEIFGRLGVADVGIDQDANAGNLGFFMGNSDFDIAIGGGTRVTLLESGDVSLGVLGQISFTRIDSFDGNNLGVLSTDLHLTNVQIALGPTWNFAEGMYVYGGPFLHLIDGTADVGFGPLQADVGIEEDGIFGGYIGAGIRVLESPNITFNIEFQATGGGNAAAIQLAFTF